MPYITEYKYSKNDTYIDTNGLVIEATYSDSSKIEIDNSLIEFTGFDTLSRGTKTVTATYEKQSATFDVEVKFTIVQWILYIICFGWIWM